MAGGERAVLRYAAASSEWTSDSWFTRHAAYAGPHLLVIAQGTRHMSSPGNAGEFAVGDLRRLDVPTDASGLAASLERGIEGLRETLSRLLADNPRWDGTLIQVTAMLWRDTHAAIAHIGSARAYMLRGGELTQLTRDHTLGQLLIEEGRITPDELGSNPHYSHAVTRWLDEKPGEPADIIGHEAAAGDRYLLCTSTDDVMPPRALREILQEERDLQDAADRLVAMTSPGQPLSRLTCIVADVVKQPR
jgi:protein phosphatase